MEGSDRSWRDYRVTAAPDRRGLRPRAAACGAPRTQATWRDRHGAWGLRDARSSTLARMVAAAQPDDPAHELQHRLAIRTERFATEQAVQHLLHAIKLGHVEGIAAGVKTAIDSVQHLATLTTPPPDDTTSARLQAVLRGCQHAFHRAHQQGDVDGAIGRGELVGDAIMNYAIYLTNL